MAFVPAEQYEKDMGELRAQLADMQEGIKKNADKAFHLELLSMQHATAVSEQTEVVKTTAESIQLAIAESLLAKEKLREKTEEQDRAIEYLQSNLGQQIARLSEVEKSNGVHIAAVVTQIAHEVQSSHTTKAQGDHFSAKLENAQQMIENRFYVLEENISKIKRFESEMRAPRGNEDKRRVRLPKPTELSLKTLGEDRVSYRDFSEDLDNQLGNVWIGLDRALDKIRKS